MDASFHTMYNLYKMGVIEEDNNMAKLIVSDNQIRFEFRRENVQLWVTDTSYKYKCFIDIYDNLTNNLILSLNCNETDIMNILDCYTQMNEYCMFDIICPRLNPFNSTGCFYTIGLELVKIDYSKPDSLLDGCNRWFNVQEYNPLLNTCISRLSIKMTIDELEEFMNLIFFIFLIDQEDKFALAPVDYPREDL